MLRKGVIKTKKPPEAKTGSILWDGKSCSDHKRTVTGVESGYDIYRQMTKID